MNFRYAAAVLLLTALFCAERVGHTNVNDPDFTGGEYHFNATWSSDGDTLRAFFPYMLECVNTGDELRSFKVTTRPAGLLSASIDNVEFAESALIYFSAPCVCTLSISGIRPNGREVDSIYPITVVNPYRIVKDSGWFEKGNAVRFSVINTRSSTPHDSNLTVSWYRDSLHLVRRISRL